MFGARLTQIREKLGYKSARQFYLWLEQNAQIEFNYSYYVKIESGKVLPSEKVVQTISGLLGQDDAKKLVIDYCKTLFPKYGHFFSGSEEKEDKKIKVSAASGPLLIKQSYLSLKQVATISISKEYYFLFLLITLSRVPVSLKELSKYFKEPLFSNVIHDLSLVRILKYDGENIWSISKELRFPSSAEFPDLKKKYQQFDQWDLEFSEHFQFESLMQKFMIRRISPRFLPIIEKHAKSLIELVQMSEEVDVEFNTEVLQFNLTLSRGVVPG